MFISFCPNLFPWKHAPRSSRLASMKSTPCSTSLRTKRPDVQTVAQGMQQPVGPTGGPVLDPSESQLTGGAIWRQLWACFKIPRHSGEQERMASLRRGFLGFNFTVNRQLDREAQDAQESDQLGWLPEPKVWFRSFNVPEDDSKEVLHTNVKEPGLFGESTVPRSDGLIEARWNFSKAEHCDDLGFHHPNAQPMTMITLTDTLHVGLPLEVLGWPDRAMKEANDPPGDIKADPASVYSWWCETFFLAEKSGQGGSDSTGRVSIGVVYNALPLSAVMVRSAIWEPALIEIFVTDQPIDLRAALATSGKEFKQPLTSDPSTWLEPIFGKPGSSMVQAFTKKVSIDSQNGRIMQQSATCTLPNSELDNPEHPLLQPWMDGSPTAIHVPTGYHLFTYPDGAYMICAKSLNVAMQQESSMAGGAYAPEQRGAPDWVMEVGVAGFEGRWCRVRTYLRDGRVHCWHVLEYLP